MEKANELKYLEHQDKEQLFIDSFYEKFNLYFGVSKNELLSYYHKSKYSGYPIEAGGSVWEMEGKALYCFIRCLKPKKVLEIGNFKGVSSNHILQAIEDNKEGEVYLLDIKEQLEKTHNNNFTRIIDDSLNYLNQKLDFDCIIQDGCHTYDHVKKELELIIKNSSDTNIWAHDYFQNIQCEVKLAWDELIHNFYDVYPMKDLYSNCGFLVAKYVNSIPF